MKDGAAQVHLTGEAVQIHLTDETVQVHLTDETVQIHLTGDTVQPGIEYVLSYFDNPGTSLPASITNFIASTAFPNFLKRLHNASMELQRQHEVGLPVYMSLPTVLLDAGRATALQRKPILPIPNYEEVEEQLNKRGSNLDDSTIQYLMEALGEISPSPTEDGSLMLRLDAIISDALDKLDEKNPMVGKLKILKSKLDHFRSKSKTKKEESLGEMKDLIFRQNRYDDSRLHPTPPVLVRHLFETMREVLKADHDMRTGRGLLTQDDDDNTSSSPSQKSPVSESKAHQTIVCYVDSQCHPVESNPMKNGTQEVPRNTDHIIEDNVCENECESSSSTWKSWLYSTLVEAPFSVLRNRRTNESQKEEESDSPAGSKDGNFKPESDERGTESEPVLEEQSNSFWYYVYGWMFWPVVVKGQSSSDETPALEHEANDELGSRDDLTNNKSGDSTSEPQSSWYWIPVRGVSWVFSYLTNSSL
ncbi:hypothetical protein FHG87_003249 [Trinorchestia longiramus]|nr:hypothetical protein FHG87_003249 [Trinorchestia longiramus]